MLILETVRCPKCNRRLMDLKGYAQTRCTKCKSLIEIDTDARKLYIREESKK